MVQVELNYLYINIGANNGNEIFSLFCFILRIHVPVSEK